MKQTKHKFNMTITIEYSGPLDPEKLMKIFAKKVEVSKAEKYDYHFSNSTEGKVRLHFNQHQIPENIVNSYRQLLLETLNEVGKT